MSKEPCNYIEMGKKSRFFHNITQPEVLTHVSIHIIHYCSKHISPNSQTLNHVTLFRLRYDSTVRNLHILSRRLKKLMEIHVPYISCWVLSRCKM